MSKIIIQPSSDFAIRTMNQIARIEKRRHVSRALVVASASLGPSFAREVWMFVRGDYISASALPMGDMIVQAYGVFINPVVGYALAAGALIPAGLVLSRHRNEIFAAFGWRRDI